MDSYEESSFVPPRGVREAAKRGLEWNKQGHGGSGLTAGAVSRARSLAKGEKQTLAQLKRMRSFFARHEVNKSSKSWREGTPSKPSPSQVAWALWGGDAGMSWANRVVANEDKKRLAEAEIDLLFEKIGRLDMLLTEGAWTGSMGGNDPDFNKLRGGLKRFWIEKAATSAHPFSYCVRHLRKHVANPERLCFAPGTQVLTRDRGLVTVEDLLPGEDKVMTHRGRWRTVEGVIANPLGNKRLLAISRKGYDRPLTVTEDHPLLVADGAPFLADTTTRARTKSLRESAGIDGPHRFDDGRYAPVSLGTIEWREAGSLTGREYLTSIENGETQDLDVSDDMLKLIGLWLAEGTGYNHGAVKFCFAIDEPLVAECVEALEREFGRTPRVHRHPTSDVVRMSGIFDEMYRWVSGVGECKMMAGELLTLPADRLRIILDAYMAGDGHVRPARNEAVATTISPTLAHQIAFILGRLGHHANIRQTREQRDEYIQGRLVSAKPTWTVSYAPDEGRRSGLRREGLIGHDITGISDVMAEFVYDVEVEEDHSLLVEGVLAHNCAWLKDQALGTTKWRKGSKITEANAEEWEPTIEEMKAALMAYEEAAMELGLIAEGGEASGEAASPDAADEGGSSSDGQPDSGASESEGSEAGEQSPEADGEPAAEGAGE